MIVSSTSSLLFGSVLVGANSSLSLTLTNTGAATIDVSSVTSTSALFTVGTSCGALRSKHTCTITVTFRPTTSGEFGANLQILYHPQPSLLRIPMSGFGVVPKHKENKEGKETKEAVVEKTADKNLVEAKGIVSERFCPACHKHPQGEAHGTETDFEDAVHHSFITPQERPQLGPKAPETKQTESQPPTKDDSPE